MGGSFKLVLGFAIPVPLGLKQSMAWGWNMQFQYLEPQTTNDTSMYPPTIGRRRKKRDTVMEYRTVIYRGIEDILDQNGMDGHESLLRSICENAWQSLHHEANGLYGHLLHILLTPEYQEEPSLDPVYLDAREAGEFGVECSTVHPKGNSILDLISLIDDE